MTYTVHPHGCGETAIKKNKPALPAKEKAGSFVFETTSSFPFVEGATYRCP